MFPIQGIIKGMKPSHETLLDLYEKQRLTTRQIGQKFGVSKTHVLRWMKSYDMPRRVAKNGLENRGIEAPTAAELEWMVHTEHLSYEEIGRRYGVDQSAVPHWLTKHGIPKPTVWETRRKGAILPPFSADEIMRRYGSGESLDMIALDYGMTRYPLTARLKALGHEIRRDGWNGGHRYEAKDGHLLRSVYEQRVDDWLHDRGIDHELEPAYPWDRRYMADFKVGDTYVEVWGVTDNEAYKRRKSMKINRCAEYGIPLISINHWQFAKDRKWWTPLMPLSPRELPHPELPLQLQS